jgi:hypothetical protein
MRYKIFLKSGKVTEVTGEDLKCVDQKNSVYKIYAKDDPDSLNVHCIATIVYPDMIQEVPEEYETIEELNIFE